VAASKKNEFNPLAAVAALAIFAVLIAWGLSHFGVIGAPGGDGAGSGRPSVTKTKDKSPEKGGGTVKVTGYDEAAAGKDYPGDPVRGGKDAHAQQVKVARWMADWAERSGLPRELPVMAALQESSMYNNPGGDRDSVGYFQMRTSIWLGSYPGYPHMPERQLKWFISKALDVRGNRTSWNDDSSQWGEWIVAVERPDLKYRDRYQERLPEARRLLAG
jgi:hypothetical protein